MIEIYFQFVITDPKKLVNLAEINSVIRCNISVSNIKGEKESRISKA